MKKIRRCLLTVMILMMLTTIISGRVWAGSVFYNVKEIKENINGLVDGKAVLGSTLTFNLESICESNNEMMMKYLEGYTLTALSYSYDYSFDQEFKPDSDWNVSWTLPEDFSHVGQEITIRISLEDTEAFEEDYLFFSEDIYTVGDISNIPISNIESKTYTGEPQKQSLSSIKCGETVLKEGTDYTVSYLNNVNVGTASFSITGINNYIGSITKTFQIKEAPKPETPVVPPAAPTVSPETINSMSRTEKMILSLPNDKDPAESRFSLLQAKGTPGSKTSVKLSWKPVEGATGYVIYGNKCGRKNRYEKITEIAGPKWTDNNLQKGTYYKYLIVAVKNNEVLSVSKTIHVATKGGKVGNNTKVTLNKKKVTIKMGKTRTVKARLRRSLPVRNHRKVAFETDDPKVAVVSKNGKIKAVGKGQCYIYAYAQNGMFAKCKVTVN